MIPRTLKRLHPAQRDDIADLVTRRPLPGPAIPQLDPFLFLNHHGPQVYPPRTTAACRSGRTRIAASRP
jgi:hypothetical protein